MNEVWIYWDNSCVNWEDNWEAWIHYWITEYDMRVRPQLVADQMHKNNVITVSVGLCGFDDLTSCTNCLVELASICPWNERLIWVGQPGKFYELSLSRKYCRKRWKNIVAQHCWYFNIHTRVPAGLYAHAYDSGRLALLIKALNMLKCSNSRAYFPMWLSHWYCCCQCSIWEHAFAAEIMAAWCTNT